MSASEAEDMEDVAEVIMYAEYGGSISRGTGEVLFADVFEPEAVESE